MLIKNLPNIFFISSVLILFGCAGDVEKCVDERMQEFYKKKNSGIHIFDKIYDDYGTHIGKRKRTPEEHKKKMKNICVRKRFKQDVKE